MKIIKPWVITVIVLLGLFEEVSAQSNKNDLLNFKSVKWNFETNGSIHGSPVKSSNSILFGSSDQHIYSVNKYTGALMWKFKTGDAVYSTPVISSTTVFCTSMDGNLYALDKKKGTLIWKFTSPADQQKDIWDYHNCSPSVSGEHVYYGNGKGTFFAINKNTGEEEWRYQTYGAIHTTPLVDGNKVYFGNFQGFFYALDRRTGKMLWKFNTVGQRWFPKGAVQQGASLHNNTLYFGSRDFNLYALNAETGTGMWNMYEQGSWIIATPVIKDTLLLFGTSDSYNFYALDNQSGRVIWKKELGLNVFGQCETGKKFVYVGSLDGKVYALSLKCGKIMWEFQTKESKEGWDEIFNENDKISKKFLEKYGEDAENFYGKIHALGSIISKPLLDNGVLFVTSMNGKLYALE
jgi:outer membrane protein assembly factor BamB